MNNLYYLISAFFIVLFLLPVFVKVRVAYNLFENNGVATIFLFGIKIISLKFLLYGFGIKIYKDNEIKNKKIDFEGEEAIFVQNLIKQIKQKIHLKSLQIYYNIGIDDAFETAMICGYINLIVLIFFTRIKSLKPTASLFLRDNPAFNQSVFQMVFNLKISISLFDIAYSFLNSVILSLRQNNI